MLFDFINLFFPDTCICCMDALYKHEKCICSICKYNLPESNFHLYNENPVEKLFRGRVAVERSASYLIFQKGGMAQKIIHSLKYSGRKEVGELIGEWYGYNLKETAWAMGYDIIIPVPLHKSKLHTRGFNQCDYFAKGLSGALKIEYNTSCISRTLSTGTQTKRSRFSRWQNAAGNFVITNAEKLKNKKILLVDDVVTTGSTLESCAQTILAVEGTSVSIVTMAYAQN